MIRILVLAAVAAIVAGCGSSGTLYRGAPPPGMTDAEYRCKLDRTRCPAARVHKWPEMRDKSPGDRH